MNFHKNREFKDIGTSVRYKAKSVGQSEASLKGKDRQFICCTVYTPIIAQQLKRFIHFNERTAVQGTASIPPNATVNTVTHQVVDLLAEVNNISGDSDEMRHGGSNGKSNSAH